MSNDMFLSEAKEWLREHVDDGARCPCCQQFAKVYRRKVNSGMARSLICMWKIGGLEPVHIPTQIGARSREEGKLAYWGLAVEETVLREDGGRAGWWAVTEKGREFVFNRLTIPKYARIYDGRLLNLDHDEYVGIVDALGTKFDYSELMGGI